MVVEDEAELAELVADYLRQAGFEVEVYNQGQVAFNAIRRRPPDLLVLDVMLPGMDGITMCHAIRQSSELPIVMVTARSDELDRLMGFKLGVDDYLCKPFSPRELVARVQAVLRRQQLQQQVTGYAADSKTNAFPVLALDEGRQRICYAGEPLSLTPYEYILLKVLMSQAGRVYTRAQLQDHLHSDNFDIADRVIDTHVKNLRRKLRDATARPDHHDWIPSVYGVGYRFEWPADLAV